MRWIPALILLALLAVAGHAGEPAAGEEGLVAGNTAFACDLYGHLRDGGGNLFLSPYSISTCLAMTREGAAGNTAAEMDRVLRFPATGLGAAQAGLSKALEAPRIPDPSTRQPVPAYEIEIANRLFGQAGTEFRRAFLSSLESTYAAGLETLDIEGDPAAARARINAWVEEKTKERIKDLLPEGTPTPDTRLVLVNAIYYKASWAEAFQESKTEDAPFHRADGSTVDARLMRRKDRFGYAEVEGVQVLELPYLRGSMSMVVVLPREADGLPAVERRLSPETLRGWLDAVRGRKVDVAFPKFEFTSSFDLTKTLQAMGMKDAFHPSTADFPGMTERERLFLGIVVHKAFVKVDEKGTEAAAATAAGMRATSMPAPEEPAVFRADRPFLFLIRHPASGVVLFMGRVADPAG